MIFRARSATCARSARMDSSKELILRVADVMLEVPLAMCSRASWMLPEADSAAWAGGGSMRTVASGGVIGDLTGGGSFCGLGKTGAGACGFSSIKIRRSSCSQSTRLPRITMGGGRLPMVGWRGGGFVGIAPSSPLSLLNFLFNQLDSAERVISTKMVRNESTDLRSSRPRPIDSSGATLRQKLIFWLGRRFRQSQRCSRACSCPLECFAADNNP